ncbi:MAG: sugar phosphate isomerase/epimerase [Planctomycetes bacterium]|nr:sugar phosphate isomerase/epimerase [Planctomycetota bacterium]
MDPVPCVDRRRFLGFAAAMAGAALLPAAAPPRRRAPLFPISLAQWSLHRALHAKELDPLDFPRRARTFGVDAVEYVNTFWQDKAGDADYLRELQRRCAGEGVQSLLIMCDREGALGDPIAKARAQAVANHRRWLEAAKALGCHAIRVNAQSSGSPEEQQKLAADGLRALCEIADGLAIDVLVENHGGLSSNGGWLRDTLRRVDHRRIGSLPDFGNFRIADGEVYDRYQGVDELMPFARGVSAKSHDFDADGNETGTDYRRMLDIVVRRHGYRGHIGIEYEGSRLSEPDGITATRLLLERVRAELAARLDHEAADAAAEERR